MTVDAVELPEPKLGAYCHPTDPTIFLHRFMLSVQRLTPNVVADLERHIRPDDIAKTDRRQLLVVVSRLLRFCRFELSAENKRILVDVFAGIWEWAMAHRLIRWELNYCHPEPLRSKQVAYCIGIVCIAFDSLKEWSTSRDSRVEKKWVFLPKPERSGLLNLLRRRRTIEEFLALAGNAGRTPGSKKRRMLMWQVGGEPTHDVYTFEGQFERWNPTLCKRAEAKAVIMRTFEGWLDSMLDKEDEIMNEIAKPLSVKFKWEYLDWLVLYQVAGMSSAQVVKWLREKRNIKVTRPSIDNGCHGAAEVLVGDKWRMWLRPRKRRGPKQRQT